MRSLLVLDMRILRNFKPAILFLVLLQISTSCTEDEISNTSVVTEDIIFISGEIVRMTGRVLAIGGDKIDDHGFVISENEMFSSPLTISLGEKSIPGRFVGESRELDLQTTYFTRSFVSVGGDVIYGNVETFTTLSFTVIDFEPRSALPNTTLRIIGTNFPSNTQVFFGNDEAEISEINFESEIILTIPEIDDSESISISVQVDGEVVAFPQEFEYIFGKWDLVNVFPVEGVQYHETLGLLSGDEFVFGLGRDFDFNANPRIFSFNLLNEQWTEINFSGVPAKGQFSSGNLFGAGGIGAGVFFSPVTEFWEYSGNGTFIPRSNVPFTTYNGIAMTIEDQLYVMGGTQGDDAINFNIYRLNQTSGNWIIAGQTPFEVSADYPSFVVGSNGYVISEDGLVWAYNPGANSWSLITEVPSFVDVDGVAHVIDNKVYIGIFKDLDDVWEFDVTNLTWKRKVGFGGNASDDTVASFVYNGKIYLMQSIARGGLGFVDPKMELWSFDPSALK